MSSSDYNARLHAVESTLTQLQASISASRTNISQDRPENLSWSAERTARDAPMSLIQEIRENITYENPSNIEDCTEDMIIKGIVSEDLTQTLLEGFSKLSSRWLFMTTDPVQLRTKSPLLYGTCLLGGLHITPSLHGSQTHQALYRHVHGLLGQTHLSSASSLDTIQSMLILSMWDLRPTLGHEHGNSWLLSGTAGMRVMMTTSFEQLLKSNNSNGGEESRAQELMRTWNLICLCQLHARDELVLAGVRLYRVLWGLMSSNVIQRTSATWPEIDSLRKSQENIYKLDSSEPLRFAYSCAYLMLARRTLQHMNHTESDKSSNPELAFEVSALPFIECSIYHSIRILNLFLSMSELTTYIHPVYENLLCSFAMVTLAEFVTHIADVGHTMLLMEQAISHIQCGGKAEPVSRWCLNIIKQHVAEGNEPAHLGLAGANRVETFTSQSVQDLPESWDDNEWSIEQEFPSLEDMLFGNVI
ncbi:uncharacterized protein N7446_011064 [Penicillium canescens]|uniref:uncharacterized protein n=1 Tax=Penicillium canescens TaxID=5083 RepID=UPI0026DF6743|nr:uncharacterized protein N7446_011064 [Penicillium canescens]KAJ6048381.1 hypothetical protein N7446_011064 [Penicillium canescens]